LWAGPFENARPSLWQTLAANCCRACDRMRRFYGSAGVGLATRLAAVYAAVMGTTLPACTCSSEQLPEPAERTQTRPATSVPGQRCKAGLAQQTLRAAGEMAAAEEPSDLFAVELGSTLVHNDGFLVPW